MSGKAVVRIGLAPVPANTNTCFRRRIFIILPGDTCLGASYLNPEVNNYKK